MSDVLPAVVAIELDPAHPVTSSPPVTWALGHLRRELERRGTETQTVHRPTAASSTPTIVVSSGWSGPGRATTGGVAASGGDEAFVVAPHPDRERSALVWGSDARGLTYGVLELADRVEHPAGGPAFPLTALVGRPSNEVRSVTRLFCSEAEDLAWFRDEDFWDRYLTMLATNRFNRFSLTLGLGYNYHRNVTDAYLYFAYPFLIGVPGYDVRVRHLTDEERERNLLALRHISDACAMRGLDFQLGLWTHAYDWIDSPDARHIVDGLSPDRHAAYCRDALAALLDSCPSIGGVTFRIHGESGVPERSWNFWRTVFSGFVACGRPVGIDLHAKGLDDRTLTDALDTGLAVTVSPKFWAEHMGPPYHQAAIRELERPVREDPSEVSEWHRYMAVSEGSRPFTRYGYADFLREDRAYDVVFRLWPGTQRVLLWGDPETAGGYARAASVAGAQGLEWLEPLTFKGREGTGSPDGRVGYADRSLEPAADWEKFHYAYRLFGRLLYDPETPADSLTRAFSASFASTAPAAELALSNASRILPLVTVAHHPSASNNYYWPEIYTDMPIVWTPDGTRPHPYVDTPRPRRFGTVSPLDPEVFSPVEGYVRHLLDGVPDARVSPLQVADHLDRLAGDATLWIDRVELGDSAPNPEARRWSIDVRILAALGRFFAGKLRSAVWFELHAATGDVGAIERAVDYLSVARDAWAQASEIAGVYVRDLTFGPQPWLRGHWSDRLPDIDADLEAMREWLRAAIVSSRGGERALVTPADRRPAVELVHTPAETFRPGVSLPVRVEVRGEDAHRVAGIAVRFRPMNQALTFSSREMVQSEGVFEAHLPGPELSEEFPLAYAFEITADDGAAWRHPGLGPTLSNQPYHVLRPERP